MNVWEFSVPPCILCILLLFCLLYLSLLFSLLFFPFFFFFFWTELSWKLIKNVYLNRGPNKLMLQCPSLLHQMYMLFINWMYFICDNKLCWTWTWTMRAVWNFHRIWITMEKSFLKWTHGFYVSAVCGNSISPNAVHKESVNQVSIGPDSGLLPIKRQAIIQTNAGLLSIGPLGTDFNEILITIQNFSFTKMHLKVSSEKWWPFCPGRDNLLSNL